jgi:hypothetical protein
MTNGEKLAKTKAEAQQQKPVEIKPTTVAQSTNLSQTNINLIQVLKETSKTELEVIRAITKVPLWNMMLKEMSGLGLVTSAFTGPKKYNEILKESDHVQELYKNFANDLLYLNKYLIESRSGKIKLDGEELSKRMENYFNSYNAYTEGLLKIRERVEAYTINTKSDYALAAVDAALTLSTVIGVGALVGAGAKAVGGLALKEGAEISAKALAKEAAKNAFKSAINRNAFAINVFASSATAGVEVWNQSEMNDAIRKFEANPREGINSMDKFLSGVESSVANAGNKNKEEIMKMIKEEHIHLDEMKAKLDEPGHKIEFVDAAKMFATTFAVSMLIETGLGAAKTVKGVFKAKAPRAKVEVAKTETKIERAPEEAAKETKAKITAKEHSDQIRSEFDRKSKETEAGQLHQYLTNTTMPAEALAKFQEGKFGKALAEVGENYSGKIGEVGIGQAALTKGVSIDFKLIILDMKNTWFFGGMGKQNADVAINIYLRTLRETAKQYDVTISMAKGSDEVYVFLAKDQNPKLFLDTVKERLDALVSRVEVIGASAAEKTKITSNLGKIGYETKDVMMSLNSNPKGEVSYSMQVSVKQEGKTVVKSGLNFDSTMTEIELETMFSKLNNKELEVDVRSFISRFDAMKGEKVMEIDKSQYVTQARLSFDKNTMGALSELTDKLGKGKMQVESGEIGPSVLNLLSYPVVNRVEYAYYSALMKAIKDNNIIIGREKDAGPLSYAFKTRDGSAIDAKKIEKAILEARKSFEAEMKGRGIEVSSKNYSGTTHAEASSKVMGGMSQDQIDLENKGVVLMHLSPSYWRTIIADSKVMDVVLRGEGLPRSVRNISDFMKYLKMNNVEVDPGAVFNAAELQKVNIICKLPEITVKVM